MSSSDTDARWAAERGSLANLRLVCLDVDGVLTDGQLRYGPDGELFKSFHVHDGLGIKLLMDEGIDVAVITAKTGGPLERRLADLGVEHAWMGREDKLAALAELRAKLGVEAAHIAHVGDDLPDLPVMRRVGVSIAVANATARVLDEATLVTRRRGGEGAVREVCERVLAARGRLEGAIDAYLKRNGG